MDTLDQLIDLAVGRVEAAAQEVADLQDFFSDHKLQLYVDELIDLAAEKRRRREVAA